MQIEFTDENLGRLIRAVRTAGSLHHKRADEEHEGGNFGLRDDFRSEGNAHYALARSLCAQKNGN